MTKNNEQITINEINTIGYVRSAIELARETLVEKDKLREYYEKQLLRKEQEYERLKEENFELKEEVSIDRALFEEIDQLKKENETLKKLLKEENCNFDKIKELTKEQ